MHTLKGSLSPRRIMYVRRVAWKLYNLSRHLGMRRRKNLMTMKSWLTQFLEGIQRTSLLFLPPRSRLIQNMPALLHTFTCK
jgi:hypothetical protein